MPLTRYQSRNEYGLADPDLYQAADKDDPEALLEGVAMAGLVGILRQLGDLAEFAAEMFHDLHEEVMATASRSHGLMARVQQLEAEFPSIEKALLCQTDHSPFFSNKGVEWHPNLQLEQSVVTSGDLPRCVMDSYEECRGPPRLFLLDKFDISGAGACLKRYTDPSFVRLETSSYEESWDDIQREKKSQKAKRRASQWRNGGTPENALSSHAKLHELFLEEHLEAHHSDPARVVKLKTRKLDGCSLISKSGESYMEKFVQTRVDSKISYEIITQNPGLLTWNMDSARDVVTDIPEISMVGAMDKSHGGSRAEVSFPSEQENVANVNMNGGFIEKDIETVPESTYNEVRGTTITQDSQTVLNGKPGFFQQRSYSEDLTSEADNYVDAPATMESETETDDECRPKSRSDTLKDGNHHIYSDAVEERMEDPPQFSFSHSNGNTPVSENGRSSFGKKSTSYSYSDTASISIDDQSDGEKLSGCLPSTSSFKSELVDSMSHVTPEANKVSHDLNVQESVSSSNVDGQTSLSSNGTCSSPRPVSQNDQSCSLTVQSLASEVVETSPELVRLDLMKGGNDGRKVDPFDSSKSCASFDAKNSDLPSETSSISSTSEGSRCDSTIEKNCMVASNLVNSGTSPQAFVDSQTGKQLPIADTDFETNSIVACSEVLANSGSDPEERDGRCLTGKLVPCSAGVGMEVSPDTPSKVCGPSSADGIHLKDTLDDETDCVSVTNVVVDVDSKNSVADVGSQSSVADIDSQSSVAEISDEHSCAFGNTADVSVSESHEDTLENGMSVPSDFNSGVEKLAGDASPTCSKCDDHISHEGFHDLSGLDNATTDIVPNVELDVSDNDNDTSSGGVNHAVSLSSTRGKGSLPWISTNTYQSSSDAGEIFHDTVVESDGTLLEDNNPESEIKMHKSPLEVSSEGLSTEPDNKDVESIESTSPKPSLDQRNRDTETKSPGESILDDNCIDSTQVYNLNLLESEAIDQAVREQTSYASHEVADEELLQSNVFRGLEFEPQSAGLEFAPQSAGIELNRPKQELNLDPTFPSFGFIPETIPPNPEDMPPLPPMQWLIGKVPHSFPTFMGESVETSSSALSAAPPIGSSLNVQIGSPPSELSVSLGSDESERLPGGFVHNASEKPLQSSIQFPTMGTDLNSQYDSSELPTIPYQECIEDFGSEENNLLADHAAQNHELVYSQASSLQLPQVKHEDFKDDADVHESQSSSDDHHCPETKSLTPTQSTKVEDKGHSVPDASNAETAESSNTSVQKINPASVGDAMWPVSCFSVAPTLDTYKTEVVPMVRLPRPRSPLVDAVAAHDRRKMKKVSEMVHPPIKSKQDDKDSLLAQIRNKSVNLKPAVTTRPSIQTGPRTDLRVAAILEKANTIRMAMAGSDEDEDSDSWSDS